MNNQVATTELNDETKVTVYADSRSLPWQHLVEYWTCTDSERYSLFKNEINPDPLDEHFIPAEIVYDMDAYNFIRILVNQKTSRSIQFIDSISMRLESKQIEVFIENILENVISNKKWVERWISIDQSGQLFGIRNESAFTKLSLLEGLLTIKITSSISKSIAGSFESDMTLADLVELCDFMYHGQAIRNEVPIIQVYKGFAQLLRISSSDNSFRSTSINNGARIKSPLLFLKKTKKNYEKKTNGGISINLD